MKSRFQNNLDGAADMGTYFELSLQRFIIQMPQYAGMLAGAPIDFSDPRYIVRFRFLKNGRIDLEVGYPEDSEFLGILDDTVDCQICCWNSRLNMEEFKKATLMPQKADDLFEYRYEFNSRVLEENIRKGQNAIQKHMYITLTIKAPDEESAVRRFRTLDITAMNTFNRIGNTGLRVLTSQERIEMLRDFFVGAENMTVPKLSSEDFAKGKEKLYCSPDYFDFKKDYFMFNDKYAKVLYIREYPSTATSDILTGLLGTGIEIMVTSNIETYDSAEARKLVQRQITAVDTDMAKREVKAAQHGNFSSQMPQRIKNQRDAMVSVFDKITVKDQKLFMVNTQILIKADSFEQLNECVEVIESTLKRSGCIKGEMAWEQEHGMPVMRLQGLQTAG